MSSNKDKVSTIDSWTSWGLIILASVACLGAVVRVLAPNEDIQKRLDEKTLLYLGIAGCLLLLKDVKSIAWGDSRIEFQEQLEKAKKNIEGNREKIEENERILKVAKVASKAAYDYAEYLVKSAKESNTDIKEFNAPVKEPNTDQSDEIEPDETKFEEIKPGSVEDDPWKGQFGGKNSDGNCKLTAEVIPDILSSGDIDSSRLFYITLRVESTDPSHKLEGESVQFYVHDTFLNSKPVVPVVNGIAELNLRAWGAFTVGAITDKKDGSVKLELDLAELKDPALAEFVSR